MGPQNPLWASYWAADWPHNKDVWEPHVLEIWDIISGKKSDNLPHIISGNQSRLEKMLQNQAVYNSTEALSKTKPTFATVARISNSKNASCADLSHFGTSCHRNHVLATHQGRAP